MSLLSRFLGKSGPPAPVKPWAGELVDVDAFFARAWADMLARQAHIAKAWGLAGADFSVDQEAGLISFERADGAVFRAPAQMVGAWNPSSESFSWAWGHPSVQPRQRRAAETARWFGERHGLADFTRVKGPASEADAWRYAAVTMQINGMSGVYRAPSSGPMVFLVFHDLALVAGAQSAKAAQ